MSRVRLAVTLRSPTADGSVWLVTARFPDPDQCGLREDHATVPWADLREANTALRFQIEETVYGGGTEPPEQAAHVFKLLNWARGGELLGTVPADAGVEIDLTVDERTTALLVELLPVNGQRLDRLGPVSRQLTGIGRPATRTDPPRVAVVYQHDDPALRFADAAERLRESLSGAVDTFAGSQFVGPGTSLRLRQMFEDHRAVLFFGHLKLPDPRRPEDPGGWRFTQDYVFPLASLGAYLQPGRPVPELVYANCCGDKPGAVVADEAIRPRLFLSRGVRCYIGAGSQVPIRPDGDLSVMTKLAEKFLHLWLKDPLRPADHLFAAKQELQFPLESGLFQLYALPRPATAAGGDSAAAGAVVGSLAAGDRVGRFTLTRSLWDDPDERVFAAADAAGAEWVLVVPADRHQNDRGLDDRLTAAVARLAELTDPAGLVRPTEAGRLTLDRAGRPLAVLAAPTGPVRALPAGPVSDEPLLIDTGFVLAGSLQSLHAAGLTLGGPTRDRLLVGRDGALVAGAWRGLVFPVRPGGPADGAPAGRADVRALGELLYTLAAGRPPEPSADGRPPALGDPADPTPLARVVRDCLMADDRLLPVAGTVAVRLRLARLGVGAGGELQAELNARVQAGHRLFVLKIGDPAEAERLLTALTAGPHPRHPAARVPTGRAVAYRLYLADEGVGLTDPADRRPVCPWDYDPSRDPALMLAVNVAMLFDAASRLEAQPGLTPADPAVVPVVLVRGNHWWAAGFDPGGGQAEVWRMLRRAAANPGGRSPVFVFADAAVHLPVDLHPLFAELWLPPPRPAELFELLLEAAQGVRHREPAEAAADAWTATRLLFPCRRAEAVDLARQAAHKYGAVDGRVADLRDDRRAADLRATGVADYTPADRLPRLDALGLPPAVEADARRWVLALQFGGDDCPTAAVPRRVLVSGEAGCGKTTLARTLAGEAGRPLVRLDANSWLQGRLGESEAGLRQALAAVDRLHRAVVLFDELDRFAVAGGSAGGTQATLSRMAAVLFRWLDRVGRGVAVVLVAKSAAALPPECARRLDLRLHLWPPGENEPGTAEPDYAYFGRVLAARLRRAGQDALAADMGFRRELVRLLHPALPRTSPVPSPLARRWPDLAGGHTAQLLTGADLAAWVDETLTLFAGPSADPADPAFWLAAGGTDSRRIDPWRG